MIFILSLTLEAGMGWGERYFPPGEFIKMSFDKPIYLSLSLHSHNSSHTSFYRLCLSGGWNVRYKNLGLGIGGGGFVFMLERKSVVRWGVLPLLYLSGYFYPCERFYLTITLEERIDGTILHDFVSFSFGVEL